MYRIGGPHCDDGLWQAQASRFSTAGTPCCQGQRPLNSISMITCKKVRIINRLPSIPLNKGDVRLL